VNKALLQNFNKTVTTASDTIMINTMFSVAKTVHDSITAMSLESETRDVTDLICKFIQKLDFGRDLEKHLNFFVEARRAFSNLDGVKVELVKGVCNLAVRTLEFVKGKLNKQTSAFVRACIAYCYITIPAMELVFERLYLFVFSAEVALLNQSLPQADSLFKSAITLIQEVPSTLEERDGKIRSTNEDLIAFLKYFLAILLAVPGHPDHGPFYLLHGLKKVVKDYTWEPKSTGRIIVYINVIKILAANYQKKLPYQWDKIDSNDLLYGQTEKFLGELRAEISSLLGDIKAELERLSTFVDATSQQSQSDAILELVNTTIMNAEITPASIEFIANYFLMARKLRASSEQLKTTVEYSKTLCGRGDDKTKISFDKLSHRLQDLI